MTCSMGHHHRHHPKGHRPSTDSTAAGCRSNSSSSGSVTCCNNNDRQSTLAGQLSEGPSSQISPIHRKNKPHEEIIGECDCPVKNLLRWITRNRVYYLFKLVSFTFILCLRKKCHTVDKLK